MDIFSSVYCFIYQITLKTDSNFNPQHIGHFVLSFIFTLISFSILLISMSLSVRIEDWLNDFIEFLTGFPSGKSIGFLLGLILISVSYPIIKYTIGYDQRYVEVIRIFLESPEAVKKRIAFRGALVLYVSIGLFMVAMVMSAIFLT